LAASAGDGFVTVRALIGLGRVAYTRGQLDAAADYLQRALGVAERDDFGHEVAEVAALAGLVEYDRNCLERSAALGEQALAAARQHNRHAESAHALFLLGRVAQRHGQRVEAIARLRESVSEYRVVPDRSGMALALVFDEPVRQGCLDAAATVRYASGDTWSIERHELDRLLSKWRLAARPRMTSARRHMGRCQANVGCRPWSRDWCRRMLRRQRDAADGASRYVPGVDQPGPAVGSLAQGQAHSLGLKRRWHLRQPAGVRRAHRGTLVQRRAP
jgi:tetratricopeptide (TPR) repeat protein